MLLALLDLAKKTFKGQTTYLISQSVTEKKEILKKRKIVKKLFFKRCKTIAHALLSGATFSDLAKNAKIRLAG